MPSTKSYIGFGSHHNTLKDARKLDPTITLQDIVKWKNDNTERKTQLKGYNSFIAKEAYDEYQIDLFFMNDPPDQDYKVGLLMVDIFTKYTEVIPLKDKSEGSLLSGLMEGFHKMNHKPKTIYCDDEPDLSSKYTKQLDIAVII
jgi:hypothetical protein